MNADVADNVSPPTICDDVDAEMDDEDFVRFVSLSLSTLANR